MLFIVVRDAEGMVVKLANIQQHPDARGDLVDDETKIAEYLTMSDVTIYRVKSDGPRELTLTKMVADETTRVTEQRTVELQLKDST